VVAQSPLKEKRSFIQEAQSSGKIAHPNHTNFLNLALQKEV
jgi:hypothetical protein